MTNGLAATALLIRLDFALRRSASSACANWALVCCRLAAWAANLLSNSIFILSSCANLHTASLCCVWSCCSLRAVLSLIADWLCSTEAIRCSCALIQRSCSASAAVLLAASPPSLCSVSCSLLINSATLLELLDSVVCIWLSSSRALLRSFSAICRALSAAFSCACCSVLAFCRAPSAACI